MDLTWELTYGLGALALLAALVWGYVSYKTRNRANDAITEQATHDLYDKSTADYNREREELKKQVRPS